MPFTFRKFASVVLSLFVCACTAQILAQDSAASGAPNTWAGDMSVTGQAKETVNIQFGRNALSVRPQRTAPISGSVRFELSAPPGAAIRLLINGNRDCLYSLVPAEPGVSLKVVFTSS